MVCYHERQSLILERVWILDRILKNTEVDPTKTPGSVALVKMLEGGAAYGVWRVNVRESFNRIWPSSHPSKIAALISYWPDPTKKYPDQAFLGTI